MKRRYGIGLILFIIAILLVALNLFLFSKNNQQEISRDSSTVENQKDINPSNWITYTNPKFLYTIKYPQELSVTEITENIDSQNQVLFKLANDNIISIDIVSGSENLLKNYINKHDSADKQLSVYSLLLEKQPSNNNASILILTFFSKNLEKNNFRTETFIKDIKSNLNLTKTAEILK